MGMSNLLYIAHETNQLLLNIQLIIHDSLSSKHGAHHLRRGRYNSGE